MANKIKLETALQKREFCKTDAQRKVGTRELRAYFLIVCEGAKTEPNYFKSFPKMAGNLVFDLTFDGGGISTTKVLEKALQIRQKSRQIYDRIWIVFDKDSFPGSHFNKAIIDAEKEGIKSAWSNEAFELWYLLHFAYRNTAMHRNEYQKALENHINDQFKKIKSNKSVFKYRKNDTEMYKLLQTFGNESNAIRWAKKLDDMCIGNQYAKNNPCTTVYKLVEELRGISVDLKKEIEEKYLKGE